MSLQPPKPVPCKACGKPIVWVDKKPDGSWARPSDFDVEENEKLGVHDCPNYKPKPREGGTTGGWTGTTKQGQMFEARESQDRVNQELERAKTATEELILKMLTDISRKLGEQEQNILKLFDNQLVQGQNILEILGLIQDQIIKKQGQQETTAATATEEGPHTKHDGSDYGF